MTRKLGILALALVWCLAASATVNPGVISGKVHDSSGVPQMGAVVEILAYSAAPPIIAHTDAKGIFAVSGLLPGLYTVKVSAPSFLPTIHERIHLQSGASLLLNVTLNTLFEAIQLVPRHKSSSGDDDDWRWALRSMANRPILRLADQDPLVVVQHGENTSDGQLKARVSFIGDSDLAGSGGVDANFSVEQSMFAKGSATPAKWSLNGGLGSATNPNAVLRASYSREMPNGSAPEISLSAKHFASFGQNQPAIQALALSIANSMTFGSFLEVGVGGETQMVQFKDRVTTFRPSAIVRAHTGKNTVLEYRYATSVPDLRRAKGFDSATADLSETNPRLTITSFGQYVEKAGHHEFSVSQRLGSNKLQLAVFSDTVRNVALTGTGASFTPDTNALIVDPYAGNFSYNGGDLHTQGLRAVYSRPVTHGMNATLDYAYGGALTAPESLVQLNQVPAALTTTKQHSAAAKFSGTTPGTKTKVIASYRWLSTSTLTPVDMFNASAGQTDPYLSFFIRQPVPTMHILPGGLEALLDVRNLLAQGYRPVLSSDGSVVYLIQGSRSIRAGLSFNF